MDITVFNVDLGTKCTLEKPDLIIPHFSKSVINITFSDSVHDFLVGISIFKFTLFQMHRIKKFWMQAETKEHKNQTIIFNRECRVTDPESLTAFPLVGDPTSGMHNLWPTGQFLSA